MENAPFDISTRVACCLVLIMAGMTMLALVAISMPVLTVDVRDVLRDTCVVHPTMPWWHCSSCLAPSPAPTTGVVSETPVHRVFGIPGGTTSVRFADALGGGPTVHVHCEMHVAVRTLATLPALLLAADISASPSMSKMLPCVALFALTYRAFHFAFAF